MIYYAYLNESPFKYYISILGVGGLRPCLFRGGGGPEFGKTCLYNTCMLPYLNNENWKGGPTPGEAASQPDSW